MGLFEKLKVPKYDMDSLAGINAIPVPAKNYSTTNKTLEGLLDEGYTKCGNCW